jgi:hypothetical protein
LRALRAARGTRLDPAGHKRFKPRQSLTRAHVQSHHPEVVRSRAVQRAVDPVDLVRSSGAHSPSNRTGRSISGLDRCSRGRTPGASRHSLPRNGERDRTTPESSRSSAESRRRSRPKAQSDAGSARDFKRLCQRNLGAVRADATMGDRTTQPSTRYLRSRALSVPLGTPAASHAVARRPWEHQITLRKSLGHMPRRSGP